MSFARTNDDIAGLVLLKHSPNSFDVFGSVAPITLSVEVSKGKLVLFVSENGRDTACDLPGDEGFAPAWTLMVKQDAVTREELVALTIDAGNPVRIDLSHRIGAAGLEWSCFSLQRRSGAKHFRTR